MSECIFCKIIAGEIPSTKVFENGDVLAIRDLSPQAPVHVLVMPKAHIAGMDELDAQNVGIMAKIFAAVPQITAQEGLSGGYRTVINCGPDAGQTVGHLHVHLLGGAPMGEFGAK